MKIPSLPLHSLSPFGPIFGKELRITARRQRNHWLRVGYLGSLLMFLLLAYVSTRSSYSYGYSNVAARIQQQNQLGQNFFATFGIYCICALGLISPVLTCTAIGGERLAKTLPVLLMTPINSWQIVSGKLFSRLLISLMLLGLSLPVLALVRLLGGVEIEQMIAVVCLCAVFALSCAAIGLFYSTMMNRAYGVILLSYASMGMLYVAFPVVVAAILANTNGIGTWMSYYKFLQISNPPVAAFMHASPELPRGWPLLWVPCVLVQLGFTLMLLIGSALILRRHARREGSRAVSEPAPVVPPPLATAEAAASPARAPRRRRGGSRMVGDNPVLWRELRRPLMSTRWSWVAGAAVTALLLLSYGLLAAAPGNALGDEEFQIGYAIVFHFLTWLLVAVLSATAIAQEKESDTWTLLLVTPVSGRDIVLGKFLGLGRRMLWPMVLITFHFSIFVIAQVIPWQSMLLVLWVIVTFNIAWAALGTTLSLLLRKTTTAVVINLLVPVAVYGGVPLVLGVSGELIANNGDDWAEVALWYLPYFYLGEGIDRIDRSFSWNRTLYLPVLGHNGTMWDFVRVVTLVGAAQIGLAAGLMYATIRGFDSIVERARQRRFSVPPPPAQPPRPPGPAPSPTA